nr:bradykinin potentiating peptide A [Gloydius blomhoffii]
EGPPRGIPP